jgi:3-oxoacyl-[acyl-carrier protein] reductase
VNRIELQDCVAVVTGVGARGAVRADDARLRGLCMPAKVPMGRFVEAAEIAAMVAWLVSEDCSFSTGAVFDVSGGRATY